MLQLALVVLCLTVFVVYLLFIAAGQQDGPTAQTREQPQQQDDSDLAA